ncbi:depolymerase [Vulcanimicrobium alpinum]|uniref:Depolymerase n=1 Tax=Vulcanimicrobium alpinum TaxID=3016050 RepID=A0AAN2CAU6_UNVUL|nr:PHB depolymerase family esterase [Vulcanimicrobium alpinum]BDE07496.1 depolymerase [Vulcanimicrobium alpinum]
MPSAGARAPSTAAFSPAGTASLATYDIDPAKVFVAGISAGGFFGVQMHVAHSRTFKGAAIYAGGVYHCAEDSLTIALAACGGEGLYQSTLAASEQYLDQQSAAGTIDASSNLAGQPVYLWSGTNDTVVSPLEMNDLASEYRRYGAHIVAYDKTYPAGHGWESPDGELACSTQASPYMVRCSNAAGAYDSEQTWLQAFFGSLSPRNGGTLSGSLLPFDQTAFGASASNSMDNTGYVFVPHNCAKGARCGLVVALHGCLQTQADIVLRFITESGIDEWADRNSIVVLYPYAIKSSSPTAYNPQGCWDWWGYDDPNYSLRSGTQMSAVYAMVQRITGRP